MIGYRWNSSTKTWERVDTTKENMVALGIFACVIIFLLIHSCYDATIGRRLDISHAEYYCSAKQLVKTGEMACLKAKQTLRKRYQSELADKQKALAELKNNTNALLKNKQDKCSSDGIVKYGTKACSNAERDIKNNSQSIENITKKIHCYKQVINILQVPSLYQVNATALNLRSCQGADCKIVATLPSETDVYLEKDLGSWVEVDTEKGHGFVLKKYITKVSQNASNEITYDPLSGISFNIDRNENEKSSSNQAERAEVIENTHGNEAKGLSPLVIAIQHNNHAEIEQLLKNGANVREIVPCEGNYASEDACMSILTLAAKYVDAPKVVKAIIDAGVVLQEIYETGLSAVDVAASTAAEYNQNVEVLKLLLREGADINATSEGYNLLMAASRQNQNPEIIKFLISQGIDVNATDAEQNTALIYAVMHNRNPEITKILLDMGADVLAKDLDNHVALDYANNNPPLRSSQVYDQLLDLTNAKRFQQNKEK